MDPIILGAITGLFGSISGHISDYFRNKVTTGSHTEELQYQLELAKLEIEKIKLANAANIDVTTVTTASEDYKTSMLMDTVSYSAGTTSTLLQLVDAARGLVRVVITLGAGSLIYYMTTAVPLDKLAVVQIQDAAIFSATSVILWWFGRRIPTK